MSDFSQTKNAPTCFDNFDVFQVFVLLDRLLHHSADAFSQLLIVQVTPLDVIRSLTD